jgi:cobalt-zinc-cadmium efflux system outer membrane protein
MSRVTDWDRSEPEQHGSVRLAGHTGAKPVAADPGRDIPSPPEPTSDFAQSSHAASASEIPITEATRTLEQFESLALQNNPSVAETQARVSALRGKWLQVGLCPNPTAGYAASEIGNEGHAGQQGAYLGQEFVTGGKLRLNRAVASQEVRRAQHELAAQRERVLTDVRIGYYDVLIAQRRLELTQSLVDTTTQAAKTAERLRDAKEATRSDLLQAQIEADGARLLVKNAASIHAASWQRFSAVVGCPALEPVPLSGDVEATPTPIDLESTRKRLLAASPQIAAASAGVGRSRWAVSQARAQVVPNVDVQSTVQRDDSTGYTIAGVQAVIAIPVVNRNQGGIRQAESELVASRRAVERVELSLDRKLASTFQRYSIARQQVDQYSIEILPKTRETLSLVNEGYRGGEVSFVQLLTTQRTYIQANLTYLDSLRELWSAFFEIEGLLLKDSLDQSLPGEL